jgi:hypothetical protein
MLSESHAADGLLSYIHQIGIPYQVHTDNAKVETLSRWKEIINHHMIKATVTEPYSPWQNRAEHEFGKVRTMTRILMDTNHVPAALWDFAQSHAVELHNHTARKSLKWKTPFERETGDTPDISHLLYYDFYQPVWYWEGSPKTFPASKRKLGRWLGIAKILGKHYASIF